MNTQNQNGHGDSAAHELVGQHIRYTFDHLFDKVTCKCRILSVDEDKGVVRARLPKSVMNMPWPPFGKDRPVVRFNLESVRRSLAGKCRLIN